MPELRKLSLHETDVTKNIHGKFFQHGYKLSNLKYLCLKDCFPKYLLIEYEHFLAELATQECPNLESISIDTYGNDQRPEVTKSLVKQLFDNCPKLKILRLVGFQTSEISKDFLFELYRTRNVFLDIWDNRSKELIEFEQEVTTQSDGFCAKYFKLKNMLNYRNCDFCDSEIIHRI